MYIYDQPLTACSFPIAGSDYVSVSHDFTFSPGTDTLSDTVLIMENIDVLQMTETLHLVLSTTDQQVTTGGPATVNIVDTGNSLYY